MSLLVAPLGSRTGASAESPTAPPTNETTDPPTAAPIDPPTAEPTEPPTIDPADPPTADPTPPATTPEVPAEEEEPRGPNGGIASNSPGPETARPAEDAPDDPLQGLASSRAALSALRGSIIGDNYPSKYKNLPWPYPNGAYIWDEWNFAYRQCTSFVAWRLNSANGVPFSNQYKGSRVGEMRGSGQPRRAALVSLSTAHLR
ncbi:hypothetical protein [Leucobacter coleopterorum]|uniref:hypothetical protein n=1 Tax=Leucobacter coleopterorum TaxID=2714933 RepID=UPI00197CDAD6|nr:hypothetical protein [Leucobacter coleopterorum]